MRKQLIACGLLTLGLAAFGCHNADHSSDANAPAMQKAQAAQPDGDNSAVAQNDNAAAASPDESATGPFAQTDDSQPQDEASSTSDDSNTEVDESASTQDEQTPEVAEIFDGTQLDFDDFATASAEASTQAPSDVNATDQSASTPAPDETASTGPDQQP